MSTVEDVEMKDATGHSGATRESSIPSQPHKTEPEPEETIDPELPRFKLRYLLSGHRRAVSCLKFSPDGSYLASCCMLIDLLGVRYPRLTDGGGKLRTRPSRFGRLRLANLSIHSKAMEKVFRTWPGLEMEDIWHLPQTTRQSLFGVWKR